MHYSVSVPKPASNPISTICCLPIEEMKSVFKLRGGSGCSVGAITPTQSPGAVSFIQFL
jgi:hypothetical protein